MTGPPASRPQLEAGAAQRPVGPMTAVHDLPSTNAGGDPEGPDIDETLDRLGNRIEGPQSTVTTGAFAENPVEVLEDLQQFIAALAPLNVPARVSATHLHALYRERARRMELVTLALEGHGRMIDPIERDTAEQRRSIAARHLRLSGEYTLMAATLGYPPSRWTQDETAALADWLRPSSPDLAAQVEDLQAGSGDNTASAADLVAAHIEEKFGSTKAAAQHLTDLAEREGQRCDRLIEEQPTGWARSPRQQAADVARELIDSGFLSQAKYPAELDVAIAREWKQFQNFQDLGPTPQPSAHPPAL